MSDCMTQEDAMNMNNEQAVSILIPLRDMMRDQHGCPISDAYFALDKAIEALEQPERKKGKWIEKFDRIIRELGVNCAYDMPSFWCNQGKDYKVIPTKYHKGYMQALADVEERIKGAEE